MIPLGMGLDAAVALFKRFRILIAVIPLLTVCAFLWVKLYGFLWWDGAIEQRDKARAQVVQMEAASKEARAKQIALNQTNQELSQRIAADATLRHAEIAAATNRAVSDYASRHRVQDYCRRGGAGIAAVHPGAPTPDSPQSDEVLAVPRQDFDALAQDALRGAETRVWLIDQINAGLAVVYPEPKLAGE
jgi:hypothetical protein